MPEAAGIDVARGFLAEGRLSAARRALRDQVAAMPGHVDAWVMLAALEQASGDAEAAAAAVLAARRLRPDDDAMRLVQCVLRLPVIYRDDEEIEAARADYAADLAALAHSIRLDSPARIAAAEAALAVRLPYYLAYQGRNDRALQALHGGIVHRVMAARHPALTTPLRPAAGDGRIRVGILSGHFQRHSVWWMPTRGWLEGLDPRRFAIFGYHTGAGRDDVTAAAAARCAAFRQDVGDLAAWAAAIRADRLHTLLIPEVGMDPMVLRLAALRLAPHQAASWGHPQTTGLPTVDAFLSSAAMEPVDGDDHYTETLVRLPGLSVAISPPEPAGPPVRRADLGVEDGRVLYWCCQNLSKYLPAHDDLFPRIAAEVPQATFVFIAHQRGRRVTEIMRRRLARAFARHGLAAGRHCRFLQPMPPARFRSVAAAADVHLDAIGWSGCNSAIESIAAGVPVVTHAGPLMRGRHAAAFLRTMDPAATVAADADALVADAVALGRDGERRRHRRAEIERRRGALFDDPAPARALARHLEERAADAERL